MAIHSIKSGESLSSIAKKYNLASWKDIYDHPENKSFRIKRPNPNQVQAGDKIFVPESGLSASHTVKDLVEIQVKGKTYVGTRKELDQVIDKAIAVLRDKGLSLAKLKLEQAKVQYGIYEELVKSDRVVSWILDAFDQRNLTPTKQALVEAEEALQKFEMALKGRFIAKIESELNRLEKKLNFAIETYQSAIKGLAGGAENAVKVLELTKLTSFIVVGACATVLTGGSATGVMASTGAKLGIPALVSMVEVTAEEAGKYLAEDKKQTATNAIKNVITVGVTSAALGKLFSTRKAKGLTEKLANKLTGIGGKWAPDKLKIIVKQKTIKELVADYLEGVASGALQSAIIDAFKLKLHTMTLDELCDKIVSIPSSTAAGLSATAFIEWAVKAKYVARK